MADIHHLPTRTEFQYRSQLAAMLREVTEARAAVAELVEADKEYDEANLALQTLDASDFASDEECDAAYDALCDRFDAALSRRAAALARVSGGAA